jgi:hypothetical protein
MAVTAGLAKSAASAVTLTIKAANIRRSGNIDVNVSISMPNATAAQAAVARLTQTNINLAFQAVGLPSATVTSMPAAFIPCVVANVTTTCQSPSSPPPSLSSVAPPRLPNAELAVSVAAIATLTYTLIGA